MGIPWSEPRRGSSISISAIRFRWCAFAAKAAALRDPQQCEAFTCLEPGSLVKAARMRAMAITCRVGVETKHGVSIAQG